MCSYQRAGSLWDPGAWIPCDGRGACCQGAPGRLRFPPACPNGAPGCHWRPLVGRGCRPSCRERTTTPDPKPRCMQQAPGQPQTLRPAPSTLCTAAGRAAALCGLACRPGVTGASTCLAARRAQRASRGAGTPSGGGAAGTQGADPGQGGRCCPGGSLCWQAQPRRHLQAGQFAAVLPGQRLPSGCRVLRRHACSTRFVLCRDPAADSTPAEARVALHTCPRIHGLHCPDMHPVVSACSP